MLLVLAHVMVYLPALGIRTTLTSFHALGMSDHVRLAKKITFSHEKIVSRDNSSGSAKF